ncbi:uncharacterized protein LOC123909934 isoform X2 [Trifolium pratense]|uniref:Uncharacterized protein n=1 Tax=Trifolium pratense TaxID=57577 RepID=A0ACB0JXT9_TRIPR|nr:uncharacterized protein LOC123909934 isoform X2 [Trifolium pratense]CAJ2649028.1 unnamed protein product [Trifolium pratense]
MTKVHVLKSVNASEVRVLMLSKFWFWDCGFALQAARTDVRERTEQLGDAGNLREPKRQTSDHTGMSNDCFKSGNIDSGGTKLYGRKVWGER